MTQIEHTPAIQKWLDELAAHLGISEEAYNDAYCGHENCDLLPGSKSCLNEASPLCADCDYWNAPLS